MLIPFARFPTNSYRANAVAFNGSTYLSRSSALSGIGTANQRGIISFWQQGSNPVGASTFYIGTTARKLNAYVSGILLVQGAPIGSNTISLDLRSTSTVSTSTWNRFLASWDQTTATMQCYINGVSDLNAVSSSITASGIGYEAANQSVATNANSTSDKLTVNMADLYFTNTFYDLSVQTNREKFIKNGKPVFLGTMGQLPTGSQPAVFLTNPAATFQNNIGFGGNFSVTAGALTSAPTSPSD